MAEQIDYRGFAERHWLTDSRTVTEFINTIVMGVSYYLLDYESDLFFTDENGNQTLRREACLNIQNEIRDDLFDWIEDISIGILKDYCDNGVNPGDWYDWLKEEE